MLHYQDSVLISRILDRAIYHLHVLNAQSIFLNCFPLGAKNKYPFLRLTIYTQHYVYFSTILVPYKYLIPALVIYVTNHPNKSSKTDK
jgi:hypothetical protein